MSVIRFTALLAVIALFGAGPRVASAQNGSLFGGPVLGGITLQEALLTEDSDLKVGGWTQIGYHSNNTNFTPNTALSFNNRQGELNLHQQWMWFGKEADGSEGLDWGFRADVMYGIDGTDTQAFGNPAGTWDFV
ncbi:MAG: outer membrane beta-barrel protein, partial [Planctomycetales bacterium]|nr:outer membrane beta-barrel protein [Planctomycetales bacterium]